MKTMLGSLLVLGSVMIACSSGAPDDALDPASTATSSAAATCTSPATAVALSKPMFPSTDWMQLPSGTPQLTFYRFDAAGHYTLSTQSATAYDARTTNGLTVLDAGTYTAVAGKLTLLPSGQTFAADISQQRAGVYILHLVDARAAARDFSIWRFAPGGLAPAVTACRSPADCSPLVPFCDGSICAPTPNVIRSPATVSCGGGGGGGGGGRR